MVRAARRALGVEQVGCDAALRGTRRCESVEGNDPRGSTRSAGVNPIPSFSQLGSIFRTLHYGALKNLVQRASLIPAYNFVSRAFGPFSAIARNPRRSP
jgi:hypothetical protein